MGYSIKKILPPQPHYISGYTGFVPGYKFLCGQSYGRLTHELFKDRDFEKSMVLTDLTKVEGDWLSVEKKAALEERCQFRECLYTDDIVPGYAGHVPHYEYLCGHKYNVDAAMGLSIAEDIKRACLCPQCLEMRYDVKKENKKIKDVNGYTHPFKNVPGGVEIFKEMYKKHLPMPPSDTPYFLKNDNPHKKFMSGYAGHVPNYMFKHGLSYTPATNEALKTFTARYDWLKTNAWAPIAIGRHAESSDRKPIVQKLPYEYGIIKNYAGHIPGNRYNVGQTFSEGSKHTRKLLGQE